MFSISRNYYIHHTVFLSIFLCVPSLSRRQSRRWRLSYHWSFHHFTAGWPVAWRPAVGCVVSRLVTGRPTAGHLTTSCSAVDCPSVSCHGSQQQKCRDRCQICRFSCTLAPAKPAADALMQLKQRQQHHSSDGNGCCHSTLTVYQEVGQTMLCWRSSFTCRHTDCSQRARCHCCYNRRQCGHHVGGSPNQDTVLCTVSLLLSLIDKGQLMECQWATMEETLRGYIGDIK